MSAVKQVVLMSISDLRPYDKNAKIHDEKQVQIIANSISRFGFRGHISITKDNEIINGHGRVMACKLLKLKKIPCVVEDDMSDEEIRAFRLADNKANEGGYDMDLLSEELFDLSQFEDIDMSEFFSEKELSFVMDDMGEIEESNISNDLKGEVDSIADGTSDLIDAADSKRFNLSKAFGFKDVDAQSNRAIQKFMALAEATTNQKGEQALKEYLTDYCGV